MSARRWAGAAALLILAGCATPAERALSAAEDKLDEIRSGSVSMQVLAQPLSGGGSADVGFGLEGAFSLGRREGEVPVADLRYTAVIGASRRVSRFRSDGRRAVLEVDGRLHELQGEQLAELKVREGGPAGGLDGLRLGNWFEEPRMRAGPSADGVATHRITGRADPVAILGDVLDLARQFAGDDELPELEGEAADRVRAAARETHAAVVVGREDRFLRELEATVDLAVDDPRVREALGRLSGARLRLLLDLSRLNRPVPVPELPARRSS